MEIVGTVVLSHGKCAAHHEKVSEARTTRLSRLCLGTLMPQRSRSGRDHFVRAGTRRTRMTENRCSEVESDSKSNARPLGSDGRMLGGQGSVGKRAQVGGKTFSMKYGKVATRRSLPAIKFETDSGADWSKKAARF